MSDVINSAAETETQVAETTPETVATEVAKENAAAAEAMMAEKLRRENGK